MILARKKSLQRHRRPKARRAQPRRSSRRRDSDYLTAIRGLECSACHAIPCEASHVGPRGLGQKCSDDEAVPMCRQCHLDWHGCCGGFKDYTKQMRIDWAALAIAWTRSQLGWSNGE